VTTVGPPTAATCRLDGHADAGRLGGKAAALDRLVSWGFPVPPAAAVTVDGVRPLLGDPRVAAVVARARSGEAVGQDEVDAAFGAAVWPDVVAEEIATRAREVGEGQPVAVRSSATVEDLGESSFAGQYRSVLGVDSDDRTAVLDAVRLVAASLWHPAPCAYRRALGIDEEGAAMAVVLMRMVPACRAGVVFTVDPGGRAGHARAEWVEGLADSLVSGRETPAAAVLSRAAGPVGPAAPGVAEALELALRVEALDGRPQDVEWAWDGDRVWLVQARPITAGAGVTGVAAGDGVTDGFDDEPAALQALDLTTEGIGEMVPGVLPPLVWELNRLLVEHAFAWLLDRLGVLPTGGEAERPLIRRVRGRAALDFARLRAMADALPGDTGTELELQYFGSRRAGRPLGAATTAPAATLAHLAHDVRAMSVRTRAVLDAEVVVATVDRFGAVVAAATVDRFGAVAAGPERGALEALEALDLVALVVRRAGLVDLAMRAMTAELAVAADAAAGFRRLEALLGRRLDPADAARFAASLTAGRPLPPAAPGASAAVFAGPTWGEIARSTRGTAGVAGRRPTDTDGREAPDPLAALLAFLADRPGWRPDALRSRLWVRTVRRLAADVADQLRRRERTKRAVMVLGGLVRATHREMGRRLVAGGVLDAADDVELLSLAELRGALEGGSAPDRDEIRRRRRALRRYELDPPLPVRFQGVPDVEPAAVPVTAARLEGWAASPGRRAGLARVVTDPAGPLYEGEVLVAQATDPSWSPLFTRAAAIVLERGGPLSHAAILARELGVPAVLNVPHATELLGGHEVLVDGTAGVVAVLDTTEVVP
jgi:pyruvate,water dikinase